MSGQLVLICQVSTSSPPHSRALLRTGLSAAAPGVGMGTENLSDALSAALPGTWVDVCLVR